MNMLSISHVPTTVKRGDLKRDSKKRGVQQAQIGLREQNKLDKLQRIKSAAKALFAERGFDAATTREIAKRAHVGLGTLFNYADDKRDLVFLIFIEELDALTDRAFSDIDAAQTLANQLASAFAHYYREFAGNPVLSRILLQELTFYSSGRLAADFQHSRRRTISFIEKLVREAQYRKRIRDDVDAEFISLSLFFVYAGAVRWWIAGENPDPEAGMARLQQLLELQMSGLDTRADSPRAAQRRR
jgi:AcrR family transcriptional regulator